MYSCSKKHLVQSKKGSQLHSAIKFSKLTQTLFFFFLILAYISVPFWDVHFSALAVANAESHAKVIKRAGLIYMLCTLNDQTSRPVGH